MLTTHGLFHGTAGRVVGGRDVQQGVAQRHGLGGDWLGQAPQEPAGVQGRAKAAQVNGSHLVGGMMGGGRNQSSTDKFLRDCSVSGHYKGTAGALSVVMMSCEGI